MRTLMIIAILFCLAILGVLLLLPEPCVTRGEVETGYISPQDHGKCVD